MAGSVFCGMDAAGKTTRNYFKSFHILLEKSSFEVQVWKILRLSYMKNTMAVLLTNSQFYTNITYVIICFYRKSVKRKFADAKEEGLQLWPEKSVLQKKC